MAKKTAKPRFAEIVPIFRVRKVKAAIAFYVKKLGFKQEFVWPPKGETKYAGVSRDDIDIHLTSYDDVKSSASSAMIFMSGVDAYYAEVKKRKAPIETEIADRDYAMRDFSVKDLDGNVIAFGQGI